MTLATGATSDGNGGWASVRFNGKSNQQNYLNYDGVDGTYVWDASPGYLNATGSQFRLQTSMESVAEFRVNSGLAPGRERPRRRRQHHRRQQERVERLPRVDLRVLPQRLARLRVEVRRRQAAAGAEPVRRLGGRPDRARTGRSSSSATKGFARTPGLTFTEAVPSAEARRRILAGEPVGSGQGQSAGAHAGGGAAAERLPCGHGGDVELAGRLWQNADHDGRSAGRQHVAARRSPVQRQAFGLRALPVQQG